MQLSRHLRLQTGLAKFSPAVAQKLVDALYVRDTVVAQGAFIQVGAAVLVELETGKPLLWLWAALAGMLCLIRLRLIRSYWQSSPAQHSASVRDRWVFRFVFGSWVNGTLWGVPTIALMFSDAAPTGPLFLMICNTAYVTGASVRLSPVPMVANGHTLLNLLPTFVVALATFNRTYMSIELVLFLGVFAIRGLTAHAHQQIINALLAGEENAVLAADLAETNRHLEEMVTTDSLTSLVNRRGLDIRLLQECAQARRCGRPLSLLLLDIDHFKRFNDQYGHQTGDDCLRQVAAALRSAIRRPFDIATRYGGEEFAVILPATDEIGAKSVSEQVHAAVAALEIPHAASEFGRVTISTGVVTLFPHDVPSPAALIQLADHALYAAKRAGRNQVSVHKSSTTFSEPTDVTQTHISRALSILP